MSVESTTPFFHYKIVRDRIPEILTQEGIQYELCLKVGKTCPRQLLLDKLQEEVEEYKEAVGKGIQGALDGSVLAELADILEVVYALAGIDQISVDALEYARVEKLRSKGGYDNRTYLVKTWREGCEEESGNESGTAGK
jgi:predicted house-cleaning noncanonical NTP pyrophosphatase (MazG superfamily)